MLRTIVAVWAVGLLTASVVTAQTDAAAARELSPVGRMGDASPRTGTRSPRT